jgi:hypothetical protein
MFLVPAVLEVPENVIPILTCLNAQTWCLQERENFYLMYKAFFICISNGLSAWSYHLVRKNSLLFLYNETNERNPRESPCFVEVRATVISHDKLVRQITGK